MVLILALAAIALVFLRFVGAPRGAWRYVAGAVVAAILASQLLAPGHPLRVDLLAWGQFGFWMTLAAVPVGLYWVWLRRLRSRTGVDEALAEPHARPKGLVKIDDDAALLADTRSALDSETAAALGRAPESMSLAWRDEDGALAGHVRCLLTGREAEIEALLIAPEQRRKGLGRRLLRAAEGEAAHRGAQRMVVRPGTWQTPEFFSAEGYQATDNAAVGDATRRLQMQKSLS